jgi:Spy/CpxP family protein refolding chaperone
MRRTWMAWSMAVALSLVPLMGLVWAQEPKPDQTPRPPEVAPADEVEFDDDVMVGLDALLAGDLGGGTGEAAMEHGPGDMEHGGRHGPGIGRGPVGPHAEELRVRLNLSDDQRKRLADIHDRQAREAIPIQGDLRVAHLDMRKLMRADRPDRRAIDAQIDKLSALRARLQKLHVAGHLEARAVLSPAQQKILLEHSGRMHMGWMGGHGRDRGPGVGRMRMER